MSENKEFKNRAYGFAVVKAINSNYNADFSGQPRTLPNGQVYATDKALKYTIRNYLKDAYPNEKVFYYKRLNTEMNPLSLDHAYINVFPEHKDLDAKHKDTKSIVIKDINYEYDSIKLGGIEKRHIQDKIMRPFLIEFKSKNIQNVGEIIDFLIDMKEKIIIGIETDKYNL